MKKILFILRNSFQKTSNFRYFLLLEILLSTAIIAVCITPLFAPYFFIQKSQIEYIEENKADESSYICLIQVKEDIASGKIAWEDIEKGFAYDYKDYSNPSSPLFRISVSKAYERKNKDDIDPSYIKDAHTGKEYGLIQITLFPQNINRPRNRKTIAYEWFAEIFPMGKNSKGKI